MQRIVLEFVLKHAPGTRDPLATPYPWYVLLEASSPNEGGFRAAFEDMLGLASERGLIGDAAIAANETQRRSFWHLRMAMSEFQKPEGGSIKHDVSVPVSGVPTFLDAAMAAAVKLIPGARPVVFGHLGDGNIHFNLSQPVGADKEKFLARWEEVNALVHGIVAKYAGSISAEHGIGVLKRELLPGVKDTTELELMRAIKRTLDPKGILNPGKVL